MKFISVPLSVEAMSRLDTNESVPGDLQELTLNESDFYDLHNAGFFAAINAATGSNIDEFEDDAIVDFEQIQNGLRVVAEFRGREKSKPIYKEIEDLFKKAISINSGVYFFF